MSSDFSIGFQDFDSIRSGLNTFASVIVVPAIISHYELIDLIKLKLKFYTKMIVAFENTIIVQLPKTDFSLGANHTSPLI